MSVKKLRTISITAFLCLILIPVLQLSGQDITPSQSSLKLAPGKSAFYMSVSNVRAQLNRVWKSNAIQKVMDEFMERDDPIRKELNDDLLEGFLRLASNSEMENDDFSEWMRKPENKELMTLIVDAMSSEIFMFANDDYCDLMGAYVDSSRKMMQMMVDLMASGEIMDGDDAMIKMMTKVLPKEMLDKLVVPDVVVGFQISNEKRAINQIKRLEKIIRSGLDDADLTKQFGDRLKWQKLGNGNYLTMTGTGKDIPWDAVLGEADEAKEFIKNYRESIEKKTIAVAIGVYRNNLIFSIGNDLNHLTTLGKGESLLSHSRFEKVRKVSGKRSAVTVYMSQRMAENS